MKDRWQTLWHKLAAPKAPHGVLDKLLCAYAAPDRFYHNLMHIRDCLAVFDQTNFLAAHPAEVELAIWFHDAIYDTRRSNNEQKSAEWAEAVVRQAGLSAEIAERVAASILATRHQGEVTDRDAQLLVDVDLSILGREPAIFWQYEDNIRKEYAWVPEDIFWRERLKILRNFLDRQHIYYLHEYREMFEAKARGNLEQSIARLSGT
ncbi:MAG TPA: hypothetical protein VFH34_07470 [Anaerolineales bacterium]|nr:hypothetical protein [Anaerolineales bacterium]